LPEVLVRGKVKIYRHKGKKAGKIYEWEQAKILVKSDFIDWLRDYDGKEVIVSIKEKDSRLETDMWKKAAQILINKFFSLPEECQKQINFSDSEYSIIENVLKVLDFL